MPTPKTVKKHGGIVSVKKRTLKNGTKVYVYFYNDKKTDMTVKEQGK